MSGAQGALACFRVEYPIPLGYVEMFERKKSLVSQRLFLLMMHPANCASQTQDEFQVHPSV